MKYALYNDTKIEATKGVKAICPNCGSDLIARCGNLKIKHWAHKGIRNCDIWWEPETEWHRAWKNNYSNNWQEVSMIDEKTGEKHIADIQTEHKLIIEFQHSHIDPQERSSREMFYKNMIWVVDGTRLKRDYSRFLKASKEFRKTEMKGIFLVDYPDEVFPINWLNSTVPVIFDFKGPLPLNEINDKRHILYCLFQTRVGRYSILAEITTEAFTKTTINGEWSARIQNFIERINPKKESLPQKQSIVKQKHREGTHYYDPKIRSFVKKRRF